MHCQIDICVIWYVSFKRFDMLIAVSYDIEIQYLNRKTYIKLQFE